jgi:cell fate (sporulation/competence/biofilm development) regulator YlbF (YheA/YmcA/DUF963 family)
MTARDKNELERKLKDLNKDLSETVTYEEKIHDLADKRIEIDLDDGVKDNYPKFKNVLTEINL